MLEQKEMCVCEIQAALGLALTTISKQAPCNISTKGLRILMKAMPARRLFFLEYLTEIEIKAVVAVFRLAV
jgi:hypothetical protein